MVVVNGKDDIPYMENKSHVWNHQPGNYIIYPIWSPINPY